MAGAESTESNRRAFLQPLPAGRRERNLQHSHARLDASRTSSPCAPIEAPPLIPSPEALFGATSPLPPVGERFSKLVSPSGAGRQQSSPPSNRRQNGESFRAVDPDSPALSNQWTHVAIWHWPGAQEMRVDRDAWGLVRS